MYNVKSIASVLALGSAIAACDPEPRDERHDPSASLASYDGEDLFRGVVLGYGPVAAVIPEVRDHLALTNFVASEQDRVYVEGKFDELVDEMAAVDPEFFNEFEASLQSGDPQRIKLVLADSQTLASQAIPRIPGFTAPETDGVSAPVTVEKIILTVDALQTPVIFIWNVIPNPPILYRTGYAVAPDGPVLHEQLVYRIATEGFVAGQ